MWKLMIIFKTLTRHIYLFILALKLFYISKWKIIFQYQIIIYLKCSSGIFIDFKFRNGNKVSMS